MRKIDIHFIIYRSNANVRTTTKSILKRGLLLTFRTGGGLPGFFLRRLQSNANCSRLFTLGQLWHHSPQ